MRRSETKKAPLNLYVEAAIKVKLEKLAKKQRRSSSEQVSLWIETEWDKLKPEEQNAFAG